MFSKPSLLENKANRETGCSGFQSVCRSSGGWQLMEEKSTKGRLAFHHAAGGNFVHWTKRRSNDTRRHFICCKVEHIIITVVALGLSFAVCNFL